jgi:hypothetical protein
MKCFGLVATSAVAILMVSCASSSDNAISSVPASVLADSPYADALQKWQRSDAVFSMFQKRVEIHAVMLSTEFRKAYMERAVRIWGEGQQAFDSSLGNRVGFLVSFSTPDRAYESLDDKRLWVLNLKYGDTKIPNSEIRSLMDKAFLEPFFPFVNQWSREFLVAFDPGAGGNIPDVVGLTFKSALAGVELIWR